MKLLRFALAGDPTPYFGLVLGEAAVAFADLMQAFGAASPQLADINAYLDALPASFDSASRLLAAAQADPSRIPSSRLHPLNRIRILPPLRPTALYDFALAPDHLRRSAKTMLGHESPRVLRPLAGVIADTRYSRPPSVRELRYYVGSASCLSGPGDTVDWPEYTAYMDIEPEVAAVLAPIARGVNEVQIASRIAGYCIFNDLSARDVQFREMSMGTLGFMRAKHFEGSNGLGPFLVTPDEVGDPRDLLVDVDIGGRLRWNGATHEYQFSAETAISRLSNDFSLPAGTVVGLGTVPGCCGLDNDLWARPGEVVTIDIERLGSLRQTLGTPKAIHSRRWPYREELAAFYIADER